MTRTTHRPFPRHGRGTSPCGHRRHGDVYAVAGNTVLVTFGADPDVTIQVEKGGSEMRPVIAIEIKAGTDDSWKRLSGAEHLAIEDTTSAARS